MSRYRKIDSRIWHDEKFRKLGQQAKHFYLYLLTSPHSTAWGAYVLDDLYIQADLEMAPQAIKKCWSEVVGIGLALRDFSTRLVAFPNWFRYNLPANEKTAIACVRGILDLPKSVVLSKYCEKSEWVSEQLANRHLTLIEKVEDEQEQEQEQGTGALSIEQEQEQELSTVAERDKSRAPQIVLSVPLIHKSGNGDPEEYSITEDQALEWETLFPALDVRQTLREIRAWNLANPKNRKTRAGIVRHITGWLSSNQNKARPKEPIKDPFGFAKE